MWTWRTTLAYLQPKLQHLAIVAVVALVAAGQVVHAQQSWQGTDVGSFAWLRAIYFLDQNHGWIGGSNGTLLQTSDAGASWTRIKLNSADTIHDIYFSDAQHGWALCERSVFLLRTFTEQRSYLIHTVTGGRSWERVDLEGNDKDALLSHLVFADGTNGFVLGETGALFATRDAGQTWRKQLPPTRYLLLGGMFLDANQGWLVGAGATILRTTDAGATWRTTLLKTVPGVRLSAVYFADAQHGWMIGSGGSVFASIDGGRSWTTQRSNVAQDLCDLGFTDALHGWIVGSGGVLLQTIDGGASWSLINTGTTHKLERVLLTDSGGWIVGFGGTVMSLKTEEPILRPVLEH
jgi:photosystem II stability/assembly factor-like uncharacterized protein